MASQKVRIAQFGAGYWGPNLLRNLQSHPGFTLAGVVDPSPQRRDYVRNLFPQTKVIESGDEVFNDRSIDAVIIATPANTHAELALRALEAGKHVLVEKPMARTVDEAEKISLLARQKNLVAMVGHTFLYHPAVRYLKDLINTGELGQVRYIYSQRLNLGRIRSDIDALWNFGPHDVSIIQYLFGDPNPLWVTRCGCDYVQRGVDDVVFLNIMYPNKVLANIHVSWLDPQKTRRMVVVGSEKMVVYDDMAKDKIAIHDKGIDRMSILGENMDYDAKPVHDFAHRDGTVRRPMIAQDEPLQIELSHFYECISSGVECITGPDHAAKVVKILSSAVSSRMTQTQVVTLDAIAPTEESTDSPSAGCHNVTLS